MPVATKILGPIPESTSGKLNLAISTNRFSKHTSAIPTDKIKLRNLVSTIIGVWVLLYGIPTYGLTIHVHR